MVFHRLSQKKKGEREEDIKELSGRISKSLQEDKYKHTQTHLDIHRHTPQTSPSPWKIQCAPNVFWKPRQQDGCYLPRAPMDRLVGRRNPLGFYTFTVACCAHAHKLLRAPARAGSIHAIVQGRACDTGLLNVIRAPGGTN